MIKTFKIKNVSCGCSAATIRQALDINGFKSVRVDLRGENPTVEAEIENTAHLEQFKAVLSEHGYPLVDMEG